MMPENTVEYENSTEGVCRMRHRIWIGKYIGKMLGLSVGILVFIGIAGLLNKMYKTDNDAHYRILWHHFYEDEGKIDNLYLGSSHVYYALDPRILDELTGEYNFNQIFAVPAKRQNHIDESVHTANRAHICYLINGHFHVVRVTPIPLIHQKSVIISSRQIVHFQIHMGKIISLLCFPQ